MQSPPEMRKPVSGKTGSLKIGMQGSNSNWHDSELALERQATRLRSRFRLSPPLARVVAALHYGGLAA